MWNPVIWTSGDLGADFTQNSVITQYCSDLMHVLTTDGKYCTGVGIKMDGEIGGRSIDLE